MTDAPNSSYATQAAAANAPYEQIERAGRKGVRFHDGAILWADGEKEVPTSGLSDETKRAMARAEAEGGQVRLTKAGVSDEELAAIEKVGTIVSDPVRLDEAMAAAKAKASKKSKTREEAAPIAVQSAAEIQGNFRIEAKQLLEREIDRLEELKTLAVAGMIEIKFQGVKLQHRNPPLFLHEKILETIRVADTGNPDQIVAQLKEIRSFAAIELLDEELPFPPPDGIPTEPQVPPELVSNPGVNTASDALKDGGKPTEYPPVPPDPPVVP